MQPASVKSRRLVRPRSRSRTSARRRARRTGLHRASTPIPISATCGSMISSGSRRGSSSLPGRREGASLRRLHRLSAERRHRVLGRTEHDGGLRGEAGAGVGSAVLARPLRSEGGSGAHSRFDALVTSRRAEASCRTSGVIPVLSPECPPHATPCCPSPRRGERGNNSSRARCQTSLTAARWGR